ncbi:MAG: HAD-IA family hydrolase [Fimbriimonadaceae bacterium]|nr:HAD-IA family hydrolase [Fimbriimonadaceae bacterium]
MLQAVVFDFDGLIADTESNEYAAWQSVYADHGCDLAPEDWAKAVGAGPTAFDAFEHLVVLSRQDLDRAATMAEWASRRDRLNEGLLLLPGVEALLDALSDDGVSVAVASSSRRDWVEGHLARLDVLERFAAVVTRDDHAPKPAPDLYLGACSRLGAEPTASVALEDSSNGVLAAKRAGMAAVAVPNAVTRDYDFSLADVVVDSLTKVDVTLLRGLVTRD